MKILELFQRLSYGELSNLALANDGAGSIQDASHAKLIHYTNEALLRLHSRFILEEASLFIEQVGSITSYPLLPQYAASNVASAETYKFIKDTIGDPFLNDVIKILRISDESGFIFPLNDDEDPNSLFTPRPNVLQIPLPQNTVTLVVYYQARHKLLNAALTGVNLTNQTFDIPFTLEGALQNYIAHLVYSHMNGQENLLKSQEYGAKYETICAGIEKMDLVNQSIATTNTRFDLGGWV